MLLSRSDAEPELRSAGCLQMARLSVNVNKFALLRNSRGTDAPNLAQMVQRAIAAGAHGITVHPRPDGRHIRTSDVYDLSALIGQHPPVEFNIEGNPTPELLHLVRHVRPHQCTLVPDEPGQLTSDHGWDLTRDGEHLVPITRQLKEVDIRVSLFMDARSEQMPLARSIGADRIELYTAPYARAWGTDRQDDEWTRFATAAAGVQRLGMGVNAGHDLNLQNLPRLLEIPGILEVSIGHAIVVEAFDYGFEETFRRYLRILDVSAPCSGSTSKG
jgi:pyridoxine 5-phosphate synthase